jgi:hypothetical protein
MADHLNEEEHKVGMTDILPNNMLIEVFTKVALSSFTDLFKEKLACKDLCWLAEEDHIFQQASLENILHYWCINAEVMFLKCCKESGNPAAIFREGMHGYFTSKNPELGLKLIETAYEKGHIEATYKYNIILICLGGQLKHQGLQILSSLLFCKLRGSKINKKCRRRIKGHVQAMWINNRIASGQEPYYHGKTCHNRITSNIPLVARQSEWNSEDYEEDDDERFTCCMYCRCEHEAYLFCKMLQGK